MTKIFSLFAAIGFCACNPSGTNTGGSTSGASGNGILSGNILTTDGGVISGAILTVTPTGGSAIPAATLTSNDGNIYSQPDGSFSLYPVAVPPAAGTVAVSNLPAPCTAPAPMPYSGLSDGGTVTLNFTVDCSATVSANGLWVGGQYSYTADVLSSASANALSNGSTSIVTVSDFCPPKNPNAGAEAFDGNGNLWTQLPGEDDNAIIEWTALQLASACSASTTPNIKIVFVGGGAVLQSMAFDSSGNLWASDAEDAEIFGFAKAQLATSAGTADAPLASEWLVSADGNDASALHHPAGLAFDAGGNLWVGNDYSVSGYTPASLAAATTASDSSPAADFYLTTSNNAANAATFAESTSGTALYPNYNFNYLAFDASGNLWVTANLNSAATIGTERDVVLEFAAADVGAAANTPSFKTVVSETTAQAADGVTFESLAFDAGGTLWVGGQGGAQNLLGFSPASLAGAGTPTVAIDTPLLDDGISLAFNPPPGGLPIQAPK